MNFFLWYTLTACYLLYWDNEEQESGVAGKTKISFKCLQEITYLLFYDTLLKAENLVRFVPFFDLHDCSVVLLVKEMSTSLFSISEWRPSPTSFG